MTFYVGTDKVKSVYVGSDEVKKIYIGTDLVYKKNTVLFEDPMTSNSGKWTIPSGMTVTYSENGARIAGGSSYQHMYADTTFTPPFRLYYTHISHNNTSAPSFSVPVYYNNDDKYFAITFMKTNIILPYGLSDNSQISIDVSGVATYYIDVTSSSVKFCKEDGTVILDRTLAVPITGDCTLKIGQGSGRNCVIKDVRVEEV